MMTLTPEGRRLLLATGLVLIAALNTGNNLLYLILSLMLACLLISVVLARRNMAGLRLKISQPDRLFAGQRGRIDAALTGAKGLLPSFSLWIDAEAPVRLLSPSACPMLSPGETREVGLDASVERRGMYHRPAFLIESAFPFNLLTCRVAVAASAGILVYPRLLDLPEDLLRVPVWGTSGLIRAAGVGEDLRSLRIHRPGDDRRMIHWKSTAKTGRLTVKEFDGNGPATVLIVLDNLRGNSSGEGTEDGSGSSAVFEKAVSLAGSLARGYLKAGYRVGLVCSGGEVAAGEGLHHLFLVLDLLAVVGEEEDWKGPLPSGTEAAAVAVLQSRTTRFVLPGGFSGAVFYAEDI